MYSSQKFIKLYSLAVFLACGVVIPMAADAQTSVHPLVRTPQNVTVQHTLPADVLSPGEAMPANFSKDPTDEEIYRVHFFEEPLIPTNTAAALGENAALVFALAGFSQRKSPDDFSSLLQFLKDYPKSRWRGALLTAVGIVYRRTGYYNQAMDAWLDAWRLLKEQKDPRVKALADRAVSELLLVYGWVGRYEKIDSLLQEIDQRVMTGPAVQRVMTIRQGFWQMKNNPGISFKCGPLALDRLHMLQDSSHKFSEKLMEVQSTPKGFSLSQLQQLAGEIGLHYQMAFREPGSEVIANAVVHWKLDHYSALLKAADGEIMCEDATMGTTYGQEFWLTPAALDSSASGYFLIPDGPLPKGWRVVSAGEGSLVFGKGQVPPDNGRQLAPDDPQVPKCGKRTPMAQSNVHAGAVSLHIYDRPVYYSPSIGPVVQLDVDYHQRDSYQPANFSYSNMGPKWTFGWLSYVQDNPSSPSSNASIYLRGGGDRIFTGYNTTTKSYAPEMQSNDVLVRICATCYELRHPDGSKEVYARPDGSTAGGRKIFLTRIVDAAGNGVTLSYDASLRIIALQDTLGQVTTLAYENPSDIYKITKVTDPFGRSAHFDYDSKGRLQHITDMIGIVSSFQYDNGDFINQMTTPYGTTSFVKEDGPGNHRSLEAHYPMGEKERVEFTEWAPGINFTETSYPSGSVNMPLFNGYMVYRNTFFWDKKAMQEAPGDYTKATIYHWLHGNSATGESGAAAPILESIKAPLENRVWFDYQGQYSAGFANQGMSSHPSIIGRKLSDGSSQFTQYAYNLLGAVTSSIDPAGRTFTYKYDSAGVDLLEVRQATSGGSELLSQYTYNSQHLPLTMKDASGQVSYYTYNNYGQMASFKNPKGETTTYAYDNGHLQSITGPISGATVSFTYDGFGRVRTVTDPEGYTVTTDYDALDRPTVITYPDSTFEQMVYDKLDAVDHRDRLGRWTHTIYDSLDRPMTIKDALGRTTQYVWCNCGSLSKIIDPLGHTTTFTRDVQGRVITKTANDGKSVSYKYDSTTSRLKEMTDAKGQKTQYSYFIDGDIKQVSYPNANIATPSVSFTYDARYNRITSMTDGSGTTTYSYNPVNGGAALGAGRLSTIDGPLNNDVIGYVYDSLGRLSGRTVGGVASSVSFDALGRISAASNTLGSFGYNYVDETDRLASINLPNGQSTSFSYFDKAGDQRLKQILNKKPDGGLLSQYDYEYNAVGQISKWTQLAMNSRPAYNEYGYDAADELISVTQAVSNTAGSLNALLHKYKYDDAGNRTLEQTSSSTVISEYNELNQLTRQWGTDSLLGKGGILPGGRKNSVNNALTYDDNGNMTSASMPGVNYEWDAADRLVRITQGADVTEFAYDGLSRRVAEKLNGTVIRRWLWDGTELIEERNADGGGVNKRFFPQGEQIDGVNYYFTRDHLGSIREMTDSGGVVRARYEYDPYGRRTKVAGDKDADFGFTGHYYHSSSGLYLAIYRAYDPRLGRWLSRDPMGERGGLNLYGYANGNTVNLIDPLGLSWSTFKQGLANGAIGGAIIAGALFFAPELAAYMAVVGIIGLVSSGLEAYDAYKCGDRDKLDKMLGELVGGAVTGGLGAGIASRSAAIDWEAAEGLINQTSTAVLKNGYYEVNGVKFSEYYYERLWNTGRGGPSLVANEILQGSRSAVPDAVKEGFFRYEFGGWEMVYNPATKEVWHLQPIK